MQAKLPAFSLLRAAVAGLLVAQLLWVIALSAVPGWHEWIHPDARHLEHSKHGGDSRDKQENGEHECAVTLFLSGACDCTPIPILVGVLASMVDQEQVGGDPPLVISTFRSRAILEHAPPRVI